MPSALRLAGLLCRVARRAGARPLAHCAAGARGALHAPLLAGHRRHRDVLRDGARCRGADRFHAAQRGRREGRRHSHRARRTRRGGHAHGARAALRLRPHRAVGAAPRLRVERNRRPRCHRAAHRCAARGSRSSNLLLIHRRRRRERAVHAVVSPLASCAAFRRRSQREPRRDGRVVAPMDGDLPFPLRQRALARRRAALVDHVEAADVRAHGRHRRGADDVAAGVARRRAQLGLPLLLAPRLDAHAVCAAQRRLSRRGGCVAAVAAACGRGPARAAPHHVRRRRRALAARDRAAMPAGLRRQPARARRQRRGHSAPARRLRRGHGRVSRGARFGAGAARRSVAAAKILARASRARVARARPRNLGDARTAARVHSLAAHVLGCVRSGAEVVRERRARRSHAALGGAARRDSRGHLRARLRPAPQYVRAALRRRARSMRRCCCCRRRGSCRSTIRALRARWMQSSASSSSTAS